MHTQPGGVHNETMPLPYAGIIQIRY